MSYGGCHCQHHSEAMEHRHLDHHAVCCGKIHAVADSLTVVHYVVVGQHNALGEASCSGGVLHIAHIVDIDGLSYSLYLAVGNVLGILKSLLPSEAAVVLGVDSDYVLQEGQSCGLQLSGLTGLKLRTELLDDVNVLDILDTVDHYQSHSIGLAEQILCLVDTVLSVHSYQNSADLGSCPECDVPLRNISCPDSNVVALLYAHCKQSSCEGVNVVTEFWICTGVIQLSIAESVLVGELLANTVQNIGECVVEDTLLGPGILAVALDAGLEGVLVTLLIRCHVLCELRDNDTCIAQVGSPALYPLQRDIAVVADVLKSRDHFLYRDVTGAHDTVLHLALCVHNGVLYLDVLDVLAEIFNGSLRRLVVVPVGVVHIPKGSYLAALDRAQHLCKTC